MKRYIATVLLFTLIMGLGIMRVAKGSSAAQNQVNSVDLVLHYKMWDGRMTSSRVFDYTFLNAFGAIAGGVSPQYPGLLFESGVINASRGATDDLWDGGGTVSVWVKPEGQGSDNVGRVFDKSTNASVGWYLYCPTSDTTLRFVVVADVCDGAWDFPIDITVNKWQHVVIVYNSDARLNNPVVYVDGVSVTVTRVRTWFLGELRTADGGAYLYLGSRAAGGKYWDGSMDDVMMFDRALKVDEAMSIYGATRRRYGR
jgi:hypothetical protein